MIINVHGNAAILSTDTLYQLAADAAGTLQRQMHNHFLDHVNGRNVIDIPTAFIMEEMKAHKYP